ncbi:hypothetical protein L873DRAFT_1834998 [Choiromyces venosus 120613-1]|uniref:RTA1-domain-containing protein n=1 Tax=Choiromyces venosus 120613-1 TaxID=1336337 RepID=A0A3N4JQC8_9PEZI|nr:hypothetical protein L873DRAFT_1834998 [Choiromyces venosus 120613-1]
MATPTTAIHSFSSSTTTSTATCVTVTPRKYGEVPHGACNSYYMFFPNFGAAIAFAVLFGLVTGVHIVQAFAYKKKFCWVIIMAGLWETIAFIARALGSHNQQSLAYVLCAQLFLLLSPLWINAFAYMTLGRMVLFYCPTKCLVRIPAARLAKIFVLLDIGSFLIQATGGLMISPDASDKTVKLGIHIYMGGIGAQELFILLFLGMLIQFRRERKGWLALTVSLYLVLVLITVRIIFRLAEHPSGIKESNPIPYHEAYIYVLDAAPMLLALSINALLHPGRWMVGPESEFPKVSRKEKKAAKKAKKEANKEAKEEALRGRTTRSFEAGGIFELDIK